MVQYYPYTVYSCVMDCIITIDIKVVKYYPYTVHSCVMDCMLHYLITQCACVRFDMKYAVGEEVKVCTVSQV